MRNDQFILCGEDDSDDRFFFCDALNALFPENLFTVKFGHNGAEVLEHLENFGVPDVLFLDLNMPGKSGLQCLKEIRANRNYDKLPIVILSTSQSISDIDASRGLGASLYAVKPMDFKRLFEIIEACLVKAAEPHLHVTDDTFVIY